MRHPEEEPTGGPPSPEDVDRALERLWDGDGSALDRLVPNTEDQPSVDDVARGLLRTHVSRAEPGDLPPAPPVDVDGYTILEPIGHGGMGDVFLAEQRHPRRLVALKVARTGHGRRTARDRLLEHEAEMLARLQHPGIATIFDVGTTDDGRRTIAMELVQGTRLDHWLAQPDLPGRDKLELFRGICAAVHYAHQVGVVHRDLKPTNVIVDRGGDAKVLDFGLAQDREEGTLPVDPLVLTTGRLIGTLPYMSPEQVTGRFDEVDARSDIYSLGVMLYHAVTGRLPYPIHEDRPSEAVRAICELAPTPPRALDRSIPANVEAIILRALQKDRGARYASAAEMERDLANALHDPATRAAGAALLPRPETWSPPVLVAVLLLFVTIGLGVGAALTLLVTRSDAPAPVSANVEAQRSFSRFVIDVFNNLDPVELDGSYSVEEILDHLSRELRDYDGLSSRTIAAVHAMFGKTYRRFGAGEKALPHLSSAWELKQGVFGPGHARTLDVQALYALQLQDLGRLHEAEALFRSELKLRMSAGETAETQTAREHLAALLDAQGRAAEAATLRAAVVHVDTHDTPTE